MRAKPGTRAHDQRVTYVRTQGRCESNMETRKSMKLDAEWLICAELRMGVKESNPVTQVTEWGRAEAIR